MIASIGLDLLRLLPQLDLVDNVFNGIHNFLTRLSFVGIISLLLPENSQSHFNLQTIVKIRLKMAYDDEVNVPFLLIPQGPQ
jgi:hypothetical protein